MSVVGAARQIKQLRDQLHLLEEAQQQSNVIAKRIEQCWGAGCPLLPLTRSIGAQLRTEIKEQLSEPRKREVS